MDKKIRARKILVRIKKHYTLSGPFVTWRTPLELVVGTVLSAQCTDVRVNLVTKKLFKKYTTARDYARAKLPTLEKEIYSTGFYKSKARYLKGIGEILEKKLAGRVPDTLEQLLMLPGVSNKTAYLVLAKVFGKNVGLAVDTHVFRLAPRMGLSDAKTANKMSEELGKIFSPKDYLSVNEYFITHGRALCTPGIPKCAQCPVKDLCPSAKKFIRHLKK
ncbi:MAG TPA: endonuclease III [Patescibacteria group bacterium]|nr:endonuclease III [Patescibacteria group bacterium]